MQKTQSADMMRVMDLVNKYRTAIKESDIAKAARRITDEEESTQIEWYVEMKEKGEDVDGFGFSVDLPQDYIDSLKANEQLLGYFYGIVAGENADKEISEQLLARYYVKDIFTPEEEDFLLHNFLLLVDYIMDTPNNDMSGTNYTDNRDALLLPKEVLEFVISKANISPESIVYNPFSGYAQFARKMQAKHYICEESYYTLSSTRNEEERQLQAWLKLALFACKQSYEVVDMPGVPDRYDTVLSFLHFIPNIDEDSVSNDAIVGKVLDAFHGLPEKGRIVMICPCRFIEKSQVNTRQEVLINCLLDKSSMVEIIQLPNVMSHYLFRGNFCVVMADKGASLNPEKISMVDARQTGIKNHDKGSSYPEILDIDKLEELYRNGGTDQETGLRKMVTVSKKDIDVSIMEPQVYVLEKPNSDEVPRPLSDFVEQVQTKVRDLIADLPYETPWVKASDLPTRYCGDIDTSVLEKAECPNNPPHTSEFVFTSSGHFLENRFFGQKTPIGRRVVNYRQSTFLDGNKDAILFRVSDSSIHVGILRANGQPIAVEAGIGVFIPFCPESIKEIASMLTMPIVRRQIFAYKPFGLGQYLDRILVPTCKRILRDAVNDMEREEEELLRQKQYVAEMKKDYINEVRLRKHDMRPYLRELGSAERLIRHYLANKENIQGFDELIIEKLDVLSNARTQLSDMIERLADEDSFGKPEYFDINTYFNNLSVSGNFRLVYKQEKHNTNSQWITYICPLDFERVVANIIENARKHGFTDTSKDDYYLRISITKNDEKNMLQIDFLNNGSPLPAGLDKERFGRKGEKAGLYAGTGYGGNIIKSIITHYGGDYDIFDDHGLTNVRLYLPISE